MNFFQGFLELYEFKEQHPEYDIGSHIDIDLEIFRCYVRDGLSSIERKKKEGRCDVFIQFSRYFVLCPWYCTGMGGRYACIS